MERLQKIKEVHFCFKYKDLVVDVVPLVLLDHHWMKHWRLTPAPQQKVLPAVRKFHLIEGCLSALQTSNWCQEKIAYHPFSVSSPPVCSPSNTCFVLRQKELLQPKHILYPNLKTYKVSWMTVSWQWLLSSPNPASATVFSIRHQLHQYCTN